MQKSPISGMLLILNAKLWKESDPKQKKNTDMQQELSSKEDDTNIWSKRSDQMRSSSLIRR